MAVQRALKIVQRGQKFLDRVPLALFVAVKANARVSAAEVVKVRLNALQEVDGFVLLLGDRFDVRLCRGKLFRGEGIRFLLGVRFLRQPTRFRAVFRRLVIAVRRRVASSMVSCLSVFLVNVPVSLFVFALRICRRF